jgi:hypothetical protein
MSSEAEKQIRELKRKVNELERTIGILSAAAGFSRGSTTRYAADLCVHRRAPGSFGVVPICRALAGQGIAIARGRIGRGGPGRRRGGRWPTRR